MLMQNKNIKNCSAVDGLVVGGFCDLQISPAISYNKINIPDIFQVFTLLYVTQ